MKTFKHFLVTALLFSAAATFAQNSGVTGPLTWVYTPADSTLTISGSGAMPDYESSTSVPWAHLRDSIKYVNIETGVTTIGDYAFMNCRGLASLTISESVTSIGRFAFADCASLTEVTIPNSVTTIWMSAFVDCVSLTEVTIGNSVTTIEGFAFADCASLTEVTIPNSVITIGTTAFYNCTSLTAITAVADNPNYSSLDGVLFNKDKTTLILYPGGKTGTYTIPNSVTTIGQRAFYNCTSLTEVTIPNSVTTIENYAFAVCTSLTEVTIPNSVITIGHFAFANCTSLIEVTIGNSVTTIGHEAFAACTSLIEVTIPNSVTIIGYSAFDNCTSLTEVTIGNSVTDIENQTFYNCTSLTAITAAADNPNYSSLNGVLFNKDKTTLILCPKGKTGTYTIPNSVTTIWMSAFENCTSLIEVTIPNSVTIIGYGAFYNCTSLTAITVAAGNPNYSSENGVLFNSDKTMLVQYPIGNTRTIYAIPNSVTEIYIIAFLGCDYMERVIIPSSVVTIKESAFNGCTALTSVTNHAQTPQTITANVFGGVNLSARTLYVPAASVALYEAADVWKNFGSIEAIVSVTGVELDQTELSLEVGETATLTATVEPLDATNKNVTFSSSNDAVATVSATGLVTAVAAGTATITVTTEEGGFTATCEITVIAPAIPVTGVELSQTQLSLNVGDTATLTATVAPADATNQNVTWSSSAPAVATVDETTGLITAVTTGTATITATTEDGGFTATGKITVTGNSGINDMLTENITFYPNPVRNELNIESGELKIENVEIVNVSGKTISTFNNAENRINVSTLPSGIYFIKIKTDKGIVTEKFVKE